MEEIEVRTPDETNMRVAIKQTVTKGFQWKATVRGNTKEELNQRLTEAIELAKDKCAELNKA